jgi:hypothetical protein
MYNDVDPTRVFRSLINMRPTLLSILALASLAHTTPIKRQNMTFPQYVLDYAPLIYLDEQEEFFPSDIITSLTNSHVTDENYTTIPDAPYPLTLSNLNTIPNQPTTYITSNAGITALPPYFHGVRPDPTTHSTPDATASIIILVPKPSSLLDAFYFSFYAYNAGNAPLSIPNFTFGNHVGDWEHTMIRFNTSTSLPVAAWYSQHATGQAFEFSTLTKSPDHPNRPLVYSARGTHANYATPGPHESAFPGLAFPGVILSDETSQGALWDPILNAYFFSYDNNTATFTSLNNPVTGEQGVPTGFLEYEGQWGDPQLPDSDKDQVDLFGQRKYTGGPTGPRDKRLGRDRVCNVADGQECLVKKTLIGA